MSLVNQCDRCHKVIETERIIIHNKNYDLCRPCYNRIDIFMLNPDNIEKVGILKKLGRGLTKLSKVE